MNYVHLRGTLAHIPELRHTTRGVPVTTFDVLVERDYKTQDGAPITDSIEVVAWRELAEFSAKKLRKGERIEIEARIQMRPWEGKNGKTHRSVEIIAVNLNVVPKPVEPQIDEGYHSGAYSRQDDVPF